MNRAPDVLCYVAYMKSNEKKIQKLWSKMYYMSLVGVCVFQNGEEHAHAFIYSPEACRFCDVEQDVGGEEEKNTLF